MSIIYSSNSAVYSIILSYVFLIITIDILCILYQLNTTYQYCTHHQIFILLSWVYTSKFVLTSCFLTSLLVEKLACQLLNKEICQGESCLTLLYRWANKTWKIKTCQRKLACFVNLYYIIHCIRSLFTEFCLKQESGKLFPRFY